ncbi:Uncharacterized conserved protein YjiS, DUF1127 family [Aeromonas sp. RU39B]|uniref:DUF1127 domain-containing protein n=1 Tax=Aeromonas sp. RU39B TaxID=1907416 RepID=UPI000953E9B8|nr:DUF1127 domain-containing protein [Aeromonas sp. RU39B]SIR05117.1 Uncharacterized conserved protein YjiS, DUF1127 family [Aeromonas sp. RU39B]
MADITYVEAHRELKGEQSLVARIKFMMMTWIERSRSRRQLAEMPEYLLRDIGLNEADRYQETNKPFWRG